MNVYRHLVRTIAEIILIRKLFKDIKESFLHLVFPHVCEGCGSDTVTIDHFLCLKCFSSLPSTNFHLHAQNPIERTFKGRLPVEFATAQYYFTKESMMQRLMHQFKYGGHQKLGLYLGKLIGKTLAATENFSSVDALVPLPLYGSRERKRGFNQSAILCEGIAAVWPKPILRNAVIRNSSTESQTTKNRSERWQNMEGKFEVANSRITEGKHILLVDDIITTGATLEACGRELLKTENLKLSVASLCYSSGS